jgi:hypothetical protein
MKTKKSFLLVLVCVLLLSSCMTLTHVVGTGGSGGVPTEKKAWYAIWGLVPINVVDSKAMAGGASNYTVKSQLSFVDAIISIVVGIVTIRVQTVSVSK